MVAGGAGRRLGVEMRAPLVLLVLLLGGWGGGAGVEAGRVLGLLHFPGRSHFSVFEKLFKELAARGHQVDVVSHFPQTTPVQNYRDISLQGSVPLSVNSLSVQYVIDKNYFSLMQFIWEENLSLCKQAMKHPALRELVESHPHYDVIFVELFGSDCAYGIAHRLGAPVIGLTTLSGLPWADARVGNPSNPSYVPVSFLPFTPLMSFWQRVANAVGQLYAVLGEGLLGRQPTERLLREQLGEDVPPLDEMLRNTSLVMVNSHFSLNGARPAVPAYVEVGGMHVDTNHGKLPQALRAFMDGAGSAGAVVVSFGSLVRAESMPPDKLQAMAQALGALPQRVVWKVDATQLPFALPANVLAVRWLPQQALLSHPKTRAFVTHGGLGGTQEAVHWAVPAVVVPFFTDQRQNGQQLQARGAGRVLAYEALSAEALRRALHAVLNDASYRENAKKLSVEFRDRPQPPLETAVFWTEYVMRHRGAPQLRSAAVHLRWYQLWLLDVAAVLAAAAMLLAVIIWAVARATLRCVRFTPKKAKDS